MSKNKVVHISAPNEVSIEAIGEMVRDLVGEESIKTVAIVIELNAPARTRHAWLLSGGTVIQTIIGGVEILRARLLQEALGSVKDV